MCSLSPSKDVITPPAPPPCSYSPAFPEESTWNRKKSLFFLTSHFFWRTKFSCLSMCFHGDSSQDRMAFFQDWSLELSEGFCSIRDTVTHAPVFCGAKTVPPWMNEFWRRNCSVPRHTPGQNWWTQAGRRNRLRWLQLSSFKTLTELPSESSPAILDSKSCQKQKEKKWKKPFEHKSPWGKRYTWHNV